MNQKHMLIGLLLFVFLSFGGMIALDLKNKKQSVPDNANNPILGDNWETPVSPDKPDPIVDKVQITASSYREAIKKSGEEGIPVLVFFEADWCSWCKKMKKEFMADRDVKEIMKNYVLVFVDYDRNKSVAIKFGVQGLPSYAITNVNESKLKSDGGYLDSGKFHQWLDNPSMYKQPEGERDVTPTPPPDRRIDPRPDRRQRWWERNRRPG